MTKPRVRASSPKVLWEARTRNGALRLTARGDSVGEPVPAVGPLRRMQKTRYILSALQTFDG